MRRGRCEFGKEVLALKNKRLYLLALAAAVAAVLIVFLASRGGGPDNRTPEGAAAVFVKAMVTRDRDLMDRINHSDPLMYPTFMLMQDAAEDNWARYDLAKFSYRHVGNGVVEVTFPDGKVRRMKTVEENGRWYFAGWK